MDIFEKLKHSGRTAHFEEIFRDSVLELKKRSEDSHKLLWRAIDDARDRVSEPVARLWSAINGLTDRCKAFEDERFETNRRLWLSIAELHTLMNLREKAKKIPSEESEAGCGIWIECLKSTRKPARNSWAIISKNKPNSICPDSDSKWIRYIPAPE